MAGTVIGISRSPPREPVAARDGVSQDREDDPLVLSKCNHSGREITPDPSPAALGGVGPKLVESLVAPLERPIS